MNISNINENDLNVNHSTHSVDSKSVEKSSEKKQK